jgi:hypothetical protein
LPRAKSKTPDKEKTLSKEACLPRVNKKLSVMKKTLGTDFFAESQMTSLPSAIFWLSAKKF